MSERIELSKRAYLETVYGKVREVKRALKRLLGQDGFETKCTGEMTILNNNISEEVRKQAEELGGEFGALMERIHTLQD